eukprot:COSAG01_NODE_1844_length_9071_cov_95.343067_2_plen_159_part_00
MHLDFVLLFFARLNSVSSVLVRRYILCPHNYVALSLANRFPSWRRAFLGLAVIQVIADIASCFALVYLRQSVIKDREGHDEETAPLQIGYTITAFGFLLFFGPLSVLSSIEGACDKEKHAVFRALRGVGAIILLSMWVLIVSVVVWLSTGKSSSGFAC